MPWSGAHGRGSLSTFPTFLLFLVGLLTCSSTFGFAQNSNSSPPNPNVPGAIDDQRDPTNVLDRTHEQVTLRNATRPGAHATTLPEKEPACLLPPLAGMTSPTMAASQLQKAAKARNAYLQGCVALRKKKTAEAEKHFRKAVHDFPKYAIAWVTLGQFFAIQQRSGEARHACQQALLAQPGYVPALLCLADLAARAHSWEEGLKLSERAIELDPSSNAVAYEYHAAANLNLHHLVAAEKSGLRAAAIDKEHHEPRVHFVLAQIYEAKGDAANEAAQLREYLRYADSAPDVALVAQYLSNLERQTNIARDSEPAAAGKLDRSPMQEWAPPDIDASVPSVLSDSATCPLPEILKATSRHTFDLIENMRRLSASERIEQVDIDRRGRRRNSTSQSVNYVAEIEQNAGYPNIREYRAGGDALRQPVMDFGSAVFALIFHPSHIANFDFRCEGLTDLQGRPAWQIHFVESSDAARSFTAIRSGGSITLTRFKGRAWITTDSNDVLRIETDLVAPVGQIDLQREHQVIAYAPVEFAARHLRLWLPDTSSLYIAYRGHRYQRVHTFTDFQLFSVDSAEAVKDPLVNKTSQFVF